MSRQKRYKRQKRNSVRYARKTGFELKPRFKYYIVFYALGYIAPLFEIGITELKYLFPIKVFPIFLTIFIGNGMYYILDNKMNHLEAMFRNFKHMVFAFLFYFICMFAILFIESEYGLDLNFIVGL